MKKTDSSQYQPVFSTDLFNNWSEHIYTDELVIAKSSVYFKRFLCGLKYVIMFELYLVYFYVIFEEKKNK